jgi:hypothetical protein
MPAIVADRTPRIKNPPAKRMNQTVSDFDRRTLFKPAPPRQRVVEARAPGSSNGFSRQALSPARRYRLGNAWKFL